MMKIFKEVKEFTEVIVLCTRSYSQYSDVPRLIHSALTSLTSITSFILLFPSCSTTSNLPEGEHLYTGVKKTTIHGTKGTVAEDIALTEVEAALAYAPNNSFMGSSSLRTPLPIGLWIYNGLYDNHDKGFNKWMFNTFGSTPVTLSSVNPATRTKVATNTLQNYGYFHGYVDHTIVDQKNPRKKKVSYDINLGEPYLWDSIRYAFPPTEDSIIRANYADRYLVREGQFSVADLQSEKSRIVSNLRDNGFYYYRPDYVTYFADSLNNDHHVQLLVTPSPDMPAVAKRQWRIGNISAYIRSNIVRSEEGGVRSGRSSGDSIVRRDSTLRQRRINFYTDSVTYGGLKIVYSGDHIPVKPRVMFRNFRFWTRQMFSERRVAATITNLNNMQIFSQVQFQFVPRDTTDTCSILDVRLDATMDKLIEAELEFNITQKSNSQVGPHLGVKFTKRNAFRYGETFSVGLKGSYEWQTQRSLGKSSTIDSYEYGLETSLSYPWIAFPGLSKKVFRHTTSSEFKASMNQLNRANYYRLLSLGAEASYTFNTTRYERYTITPLTLTYNKLQSTSPRFDEISATNSALLISLRDQFIPAMQFSYRYDETKNPRLRRKRMFEATLKESGNLVSAVMAASGKSFTMENKKLFDSPYSQFLKGTVELRNSYKLSEKSSLVTRLQAGAVWTYGNSSIAPYSELFYVGGANSIRAFGVRSIGPGSYYDREGRGTYLDQAGDLKVEANVEYRFNLVSNLHGALFLDAGNVWLLREDDSHPGGKFSTSNLLDEIALGTGFGFRYDLEFLVLRLDLGIAIHAPYDTGKSGYYNIPKFWDGLGFHFAVGYPF